MVYLPTLLAVATRTSCGTLRLYDLSSSKELACLSIPLDTCRIAYITVPAVIGRPADHCDDPPLLSGSKHAPWLEHCQRLALAGSSVLVMGSSEGKLTYLDLQTLEQCAIAAEPHSNAIAHLLSDTSTPGGMVSVCRSGLVQLWQWQHQVLKSKAATTILLRCDAETNFYIRGACQRGLLTHGHVWLMVQQPSGQDSLQMYDSATASRALHSALEDHVAPVTGLCFSDENVLSVDAHGTLKVWDGARNVLLREYNLHMPVTACCCASADGLVVVAANQQLYCLSTENQREAINVAAAARPTTPSLQAQKSSLDLSTQATIARLQLDQLRLKEQENRIMARDRDIERITATREQAKRTTAPPVQPKAVRRRALKQYTKQLHPPSRMLERVRSKYQTADADSGTAVDPEDLTLLARSLPEVGDSDQQLSPSRVQSVPLRCTKSDLLSRLQ